MSQTAKPNSATPPAALEPQESRSSAGKPMVVAAHRKPGAPVELRPDPRYPLILNRAQLPATECFSIIRSRLLSVQGQLGIRSVLVTSTEQEEGKTLISLNLAVSFGQLGQKNVLLVDGDLRRSGVSNLLQLQHAMGLSDFLRGGKSFSSVVQPTSFPSLSVVAAGSPPEGSLPELLEGPRWGEFLELAKEQFDLVLVDSVPAAAPVADFELLLGSCGAVLLVVQIRKTTRESIARAMLRIDRKKLLGVLVNNAEQPDRYKYSYYSRGRNTE